MKISKEEAIEVLKNDIEICTIQQKQACEMAIKALEQTELNPSYNSVKTELKQNIEEAEQLEADLRNAYDCGYNCGYADAMNDIAESEGY